MRKRKQNEKLKPYLLGLLFGYSAMLLTILPASLVLSLMKSASAGAGAAAVVALTIGGFVCGKTAGLVRRKDGLRTGLLCGLMFAVPMVLIALITSTKTNGFLFLKIALCMAFAAVGGVSGVNSSEER